MTRKLIAFDIDGTLLNSKGEVLPNTLKALKQLREKNHLVTLATGRSYAFAKDIIHALDFENYLLTNGAIGFLNHQPVLEKTLDFAELNRFDKRCKEYGIGVIYQNAKETYRNISHVTPEMETAMASFGQPVPPFKEHFLQQGNMNQAIAFYPDTLDETMEKELFSRFDLVRWNETGVDILPKGNSKGKGLLKMAQIAGIAKADTIAFGDGLNDREMLKEVGLGVVMGNAKDEVKSYGDLITDTNDNDGIYKALQHFNLL